MRRAGNLFEQVCSFDNLVKACRKAMKGKKDKESVAWFNFNMEFELIKLQKQLVSGAYEPGPYRCFFVHDPKERYICSVDFKDRVVHHAICRVLEPLFEKWFIHYSYACRIDKGTHRAVSKVQNWSVMTGYFLKADVRKFFESVDHGVLKSLLSRKIKDKKLLKLLEKIIDKPVPGYIPGKGLEIGNLTSQWLANFYLDPLDHYIKDKLGLRHYIRYMDDFVSLSDDKGMLHEMKLKTGEFLNEKLKLELKEKACFVAPVNEGIPFLGFRIFPGVVRVKRRGLLRFMRKFRTKERLYKEERINEVEFIRSAVSLIGHVGHGNTLAMRRKFFARGEG